MFLIYSSIPPCQKPLLNDSFLSLKLLFIFQDGYAKHCLNYVHCNNLQVAISPITKWNARLSLWPLLPLSHTWKAVMQHTNTAIHSLPEWMQQAKALQKLGCEVLCRRNKETSFFCAMPYNCKINNPVCNMCWTVASSCIYNHQNAWRPRLHVMQVLWTTELNSFRMSSDGMDTKSVIYFRWMLLSRVPVSLLPWTSLKSVPKRMLCTEKARLTTSILHLELCC